MRKAFATSFTALFLLTGCGQSEAQKDYARCNDEYASGTECTKEEFKKFLLFDYEDQATIIGGLDKATAETQRKVIDEIDSKVEEIFN